MQQLVANFSPRIQQTEIHDACEWDVRDGIENYQ